MRFDFSNQQNKNDPDGKTWNKPRIVRAIVFILIGLGIGFWLHNSKKDPVPPHSVAPQQVSHGPEQITEKVLLPAREVS